MWKKIGVVAVDSGQLMICDPCYIDRHWVVEKQENKSDSGVHKGKFSYLGMGLKTVKNKYGQIDFPRGHSGLAVALQCGYGDGLYEVHARFNKADRITEVRITLQRHL